MKSLISLSILLFLFASCSSIYFQEIQPKGGENQTHMPKDLYGTWIGDTESWIINENGFTNVDYIKDSLENIIDTVYRTTPLSDSTRIFRTNDFYVLNVRENSQYWEVIFIKPVDNGDIYFYFVSDPKIFTKIKGIKLEEANYYIDGEYRTINTVEPEVESDLKFESAVFSGQMKPKSLRKVLNSLTPTIFGKDGKIYGPENDSIN